MSGSIEWYTPDRIIEAARLILGHIELDPASCAAANEVVRAERYYTAEQDGLLCSWACSTLWMNPPYSKVWIQSFVTKLIEELPRIGQALVLVDSATDTKWCQQLLRHCRAACLLSGRVRFWRLGMPAKTPPRGQILLYFGADDARFRAVASHLGKVMA
jgi:ParB family chromosome partitioning protein